MKGFQEKERWEKRKNSKNKHSERNKSGEKEELWKKEAFKNNKTKKDNNAKTTHISKAGIVRKVSLETSKINRSTENNSILQYRKIFNDQHRQIYFRQTGQMSSIQLANQYSPITRSSFHLPLSLTVSDAITNIQTPVAIRKFLFFFLIIFKNLFSSSALTACFWSDEKSHSHKIWF